MFSINYEIHNVSTYLSSRATGDEEAADWLCQAGQCS